MGVAAGSNAQFTLPFDATLSPDGKIAYFIAVSPTGPGIFTTNIGSSSVTQMVAGDPLASPMALDVTSNGTTLYIADAAAGADVGDFGNLFTLDAKGGSLLAVESTRGYRPRGLTVVNQGTDQVYFSGNDPADGRPGIFKIADGAVTVTTVAKGAPLMDPSGLVVAKNGDIYVADTADSEKTAQVLKISGSTVTPLVTGLRLGYPAGISITQDNAKLLISALNVDTGRDVVIKYTLADGTKDPITNDVIGKYQESAGLHRAKNVESYVWADSLGCDPSAAAGCSGGTVYVLNAVQ